LINQCDKAFDEKKILWPERALCKNYLDRVDITIIR
jgi:hypothetical protein